MIGTYKSDSISLNVISFNQGTYKVEITKSPFLNGIGKSVCVENYLKYFIKMNNLVKEFNDGL